MRKRTKQHLGFRINRRIARASFQKCHTVVSECDKWLRIRCGGMI